MLSRRVDSVSDNRVSMKNNEKHGVIVRIYKVKTNGSKHKKKKKREKIEYKKITQRKRWKICEKVLKRD